MRHPGWVMTAVVAFTLLLPPHGAGAASPTEVLQSHVTQVCELLRDPDLGKREAVAEIERHGQLATIPVVALTGCRELQSELAGRGFDGVLIKPIEVADRPSMIRRVLRSNDPPVSLDQRGAA